METRFWGLLAQAKLLDERSVAFEILLHEVVQQTSSLSDQHEQSTARVMIVLVGLEVLCEVVDTLGEYGNLNLGCSGIVLVLTVLLDKCGAIFFREHWLATPYDGMSPPPALVVT